MPGQFGFSDDPVTDATMHNADVARLRAMGLNPDGSPAKQGPYQSAHTTTDWHGGLLGQEIGRSTPFMQQNDRNEQLSAASRAQQIQSLGLARAQAMGTAPSAAGLGQQMALGQGANQMRAGMSGGNMLAMRGALGGGYGQMGQAVDQAGQARGQEQAQGLGMYGQGANALGQSDVNQMGLALQNRYRNQQLGMTQSNQNYTFGKGLEDLNSQNNNAQQQLDLQQDANSKMQQARRDAQAQQNAQLGIGVGTAAAGAALAFL